MNHSLGIAIESLVAVLLLLTIGYCMLLNARLKRLKADEHSLKATIAELITATEIAERAIGGLKHTVRDVNENLGSQLASAAQMADQLKRQLAEGERLVLYRRMARAASRADLDALREEMRDRFGPPPTLVDNLLAAMDLRRRMREMMMLSAILKGNQLEVKFHPDAPVETAKLVALTDANRRRMRLSPSFQVMVQIETGAGEARKPRSTLSSA